MTKRLADTLTVNVNFVETLDQSKLAKKLAASSCAALADYEDYDGYAPKELTIDVVKGSAYTPQKLIDILCHEMVHVEQLARKRMDYTVHVDKKRWLGKIFDMRGVDHYDYPWEIEAHGKEIGLAARFAERHARKIGLMVYEEGERRMRRSIVRK
jgi:hypothetical protein